MPSQRIPCSDCASKKAEIEQSGRFKVTSCEQITGDPGWCLIKYERVNATAATAVASAAEELWQRIPCVDCASKKEEIELVGRFKVTGCKAITGDPGWCRLTYKRVVGGNAATGVPPPAEESHD